MYIKMQKLRGQIWPKYCIFPYSSVRNILCDYLQKQVWSFQKLFQISEGVSKVLYQEYRKDNTICQWIYNGKQQGYMDGILKQSK